MLSGRKREWTCCACRAAPPCARCTRCRRLYGVTDVVGHPVLVISVDLVAREAMIVTRTTSPHARGNNAIVHPAQPDLGLDSVGWWRMEFPKSVPFPAFDEPDVKRRGELDEATWAKVLDQMKGTRE